MNTSNSLLSIQNVTKEYHNHRALDSVSFDVPKGSVFGLLGPNGAGKTSLIRIITQITRPDTGIILFDGKPLLPEHIGGMGYLPEERGLYKKMKVGEQLIYLSRLKGLSTQECKLALKDWSNRFELKEWWNKNIEDLSKGMQQKVQFIATVLHKPKLIILDEPFSGFDPVNADLIKKEIHRLNQEGATILFSTHRMESVEELCDRIVMIHKSKKVIEGEKSEIKARYKLFQFELITKNSLKLDTLPLGIEVTFEKVESDCVIYNFRLTDVSSNALLLWALEQSEIVSFKEILPTIHDIFVSLVRENSDPNA